MSDKITIEVSDLSKVSDGYHTIAELYDHRCLLWINLLMSNGCPGPAFWVKNHYEGWDLLACGKISIGQLSYHVPEKFRYLYELCLTEKPKEYAEKMFDGHSSKDVLERLKLWAEEK